LIYILVIYFTIILVIGFKTKESKSTKDFIYAGRKLTAIPLAFTLVTTWYGGISIIGQEIAWNGISTWIYFCLTYYISAYIYSEFISDKIIDRDISSLSDGILKYMGKKSAIISIPIILLYLSPAPYLIMLGNIIDKFAFNSQNFGVSVLIGALVSTLYCFKGGFKSIINTDRYQFIFMFSGFLLMIIYIIFYYDYGFAKLGNIYANNPKLFNIPGNEGWSYIIAWGFLAILTFIDPSFHQRTFASKNKNEIKKGIRISILCWFIFDMMTLFCGLYAINMPLETPYISLSETIFKGAPIFEAIFIIGILSIIMSTIDSFTFISAITIGRDVRKIFNKSYNQNHINWGLFLSIIISLIIILFFDNNHISAIWFKFGSYMVSSLLVPFLLIALNIKIKKPFILILLPTVITIFLDIMQIDSKILLYPGLCLSIILSMIFKARTKQSLN